MSMAKRILIVDDSRTTLEVVKVHLMSQGYRFYTASNATEAFATALLDPPHLIISDLVMPGVTGIELCKQVRSQRQLWRIPFVVVTAAKDETLKRDAFAAGVDAFVRKPLDSARLQSLVTELLNR
jgi:two-component system, OmpR family, alkaline phosphatase synthesis response regulator PhoP